MGNPGVRASTTYRPCVIVSMDRSSEAILRILSWNGPVRNPLDTCRWDAYSKPQTGFSQKWSRNMFVSGCRKFLLTAPILAGLVALHASNLQAQARGGTPQTDKVQPVNS